MRLFWVSSTFSAPCTADLNMAARLQRKGLAAEPFISTASIGTVFVLSHRRVNGTSDGLNGLFLTPL